ncbi:MAG: pyridoxine 5'-phosphate synthase [Planctomycetia bacterium]
MLRLVVSLDPFAALRRAPGAKTPDLHALAHAALLGGASGVRLTLGDEAEAADLRRRLDGALLLDIPPEATAVEAALRIRPERVCVVPREAGPGAAALAPLLERLGAGGLSVALRVPPTEQAVLLANEAGAAWADLDTRALAAASQDARRWQEFRALGQAASTARQVGLRVTAGGGLDAPTLARLAALDDLEEVHVGFQALARALFTGLAQAVRDLRGDLAAHAPAAGGDDTP